MITKTIEWNEVSDGAPQNPDAVFLLDFSIDKNGHYLQSPCFGNYDSVIKLYYDENWKDLNAQPIYWAYFPCAV